MLLFKPSGWRRVVELRTDFGRFVVAFRTSILEGVAVAGAANVTIAERKRMIAVKRVFDLYIRERVHQRLVGVYTTTRRKGRVCSNADSRKIFDAAAWPLLMSACSEWYLYARIKARRALPQVGKEGSISAIRKCFGLADDPRKIHGHRVLCSSATVSWHSMRQSMPPRRFRFDNEALSEAKTSCCSIHPSN